MSSIRATSYLAIGVVFLFVAPLDAAVRYLQIDEGSTPPNGGQVTFYFIDCDPNPFADCNGVTDPCEPVVCSATIDCEQTDNVAFASALASAVNTAACNEISALPMGNGLVELTYPDDQCICIKSSASAYYWPLTPVCADAEVCMSGWLMYLVCVELPQPFCIAHSAFSSSAVEVNFDQFPSFPLTLLTDQIPGLHFNSTAYVQHNEYAASPPAELIPASGVLIRVVFDPPVLRFGCTYDKNLPAQLRAYDGQGGEAFCDFPINGGFAGVQFDNGRLIHAVELFRVYEYGCQFLPTSGFDNFIFDYPPCGDPGIVAVKDGDLELITFELADAAPYQLEFNDAREHLWFDRAKTLPLNPFQTYFARDKGDLNNDGLINGDDLAGFVSAMISGSLNPEGDFSNNQALDLADIPPFVTALLEGHPAEGVIAYIEALDFSTALGDAPVNLLTDPDANGSFTLAQIQRVTLLEFTTLPTGGGLGHLHLPPPHLPTCFHRQHDGRMGR